METVAILLVALLFGGMTLFATGFASVLFKTLPPETAGTILRDTFPRFYLFVIATAVVAGGVLVPVDLAGAIWLGGIGVTAIAARELLTPAINRATDTGATRRFSWLHGLSVALTLAHIAIAAWVLTRFLN
jgi:hypothetical protein